jgi:hypothetical protein
MNRFRNAYTPHRLQRHNSPTPSIGRPLLKQPRSLGVSIDIVIVFVLVIFEPVELELVGVAHMAVSRGGLVVDELVGRRDGPRSDVEEDVRDWEMLVSVALLERCTHRGT